MILLLITCASVLGPGLMHMCRLVSTGRQGLGLLACDAVLLRCSMFKIGDAEVCVQCLGGQKSVSMSVINDASA
jgi:hypothetical protein